MLDAAACLAASDAVGTGFLPWLFDAPPCRQPACMLAFPRATPDAPGAVGVQVLAPHHSVVPTVMLPNPACAELIREEVRGWHLADLI